METVNKNPFTEVERTRINYRFLLVGPQWSRIAQEISSSASKRTPLMVRNYWIRNERRIEHVRLYMAFPNHNGSILIHRKFFSIQRRNASLIDSGTHQQTFAARKNQISKSTFQRLTPYINERYPFKYEEEEEEVPEEIINEIQLRIQEAQEKLNNLIETSKINVPTNGGRFLKEQLDFTQLL
ncbi:hypothetical protein G9A89_011540 [Geosiphon pyriformis]|nr:hypothetical protein G9A89_011540 [Geosiphon pyriformis]